MDDLKFNIYAMARPQTREDYSLLLDEALRMAEELEAMVDRIGVLLRSPAAR